MNNSPQELSNNPSTEISQQNSTPTVQKSKNTVTLNNVTTIKNVKINEKLGGGHFGTNLW